MIGTFWEGGMGCFEGTYVGAPTAEDIRKVLKRYADEWFPGLISSVDSLQWF